MTNSIASNHFALLLAKQSHTISMWWALAHPLMCKIVCAVFGARVVLFEESERVQNVVNYIPCTTLFCPIWSSEQEWSWSKEVEECKKVLGTPKALFFLCARYVIKVAAACILVMLPSVVSPTPILALSVMREVPKCFDAMYTPPLLFLYPRYVFRVAVDWSVVMRSLRSLPYADPSF